MMRGKLARCNHLRSSFDIRFEPSSSPIVMLQMVVQDKKPSNHPELFARTLKLLSSVSCTKIKGDQTRKIYLSHSIEAGESWLIHVISTSLLPLSVSI